MKFAPKIVQVTSVETDKKLFVREMSWRERKEFEKQVGLGKPDVDQENLPHFPERLILCSICDETGALVFQADDIKAVEDLPASVFWALFREAQKLNTLTDVNVETETKN